MPKLDNERSIRLTKREMLLIQDILKEIIEDSEQDTDLLNNKLAIEQTKCLKDILFKLDKKLCSASVVETTKHE